MLLIMEHKCFISAKDGAQETDSDSNKLKFTFHGDN